MYMGLISVKGDIGDRELNRKNLTTAAFKQGLARLIGVPEWPPIRGVLYLPGMGVKGPAVLCYWAGSSPREVWL